MQLDEKKEKVATIVSRLIGGGTTEKEDDALLEQLDLLIPDPEYMNYIYWSEKFYDDDGRFDIDSFIEKCFEYKPIAL